MTDQPKPCDCVLDRIRSKPFSSWSYIEKMEIIQEDRPTPELSASKTRNKKLYKFQKSWYNINTWLCGCSTLQALFCWPCLLFSPNPSSFDNVHTGMTDMSNFSVIKQRHCASTDHYICLGKLAKFGKVRIETSANTAFKEEVERKNKTVRTNRYVLSRLIDNICFLGKQELPLRGHNESKSSSNKGNYLELLYFMAQTDEILSEHLKTATIFSGTSPDIQNDLIASIASIMRQSINDDISKSKFVSIIVDETTDISHKSQLATVLRYVSDDKVEERFIKFEDVSFDKTATALFQLVKTTLEEYNVGNKLICQTYDGAAVMSGARNGLQKLVREKFPSAIYVHCFAHKLNLVLQQSLTAIKTCKIFFFHNIRIECIFFQVSSPYCCFGECCQEEIPFLGTNQMVLHTSAD